MDGRRNMCAEAGEILQLLNKRPAPSALSLGSPLSSFCGQLPSHIREIVAGWGNSPNNFPLTWGRLLGAVQPQQEIDFILKTCLVSAPQQSPQCERELVGGIAPPCNNLPNVRGKLSAEGGERAPKRQRRGGRTLVEELKDLADPCAAGAITPEEYQDLKGKRSSGAQPE